jgi:hypothetical protein
LKNAGPRRPNIGHLVFGEVFTSTRAALETAGFHGPILVEGV